MPAYSANSVNTNGQDEYKVSDVVVAVFKERRERLQGERRQTWLDEIARKHQVEK